MFTTGLPEISLAFFSAASEAVAIPTGVQIFCFIATVLVGRVTLSVPMLYAAGALAIFVIGGLTGVMVAIVPFNFQAHDTYFIVAHLHYTLIGGVVFPLIAGLYYWYPFQFGKMLSDRLGTIGFWLMFVGFNITFMTMHWTGLMGMPRRVFTYPEGLGWDIPNLVSSSAAFLIAAGFAVIVWDVLRPKGREPLAPRNPWNAPGMEWTSRQPGESWGSRSIPIIRSRYPIWEQENLTRDIDEGRFYLPDAEEGKREFIVTDILDSDPMQVQRVPGPTYKTLLAAALLGGSFITGTFKWWWIAGLLGVGAIAAIIWWLWTGTEGAPDKAEKDAGLGLVLPVYGSGSSSVGWWALFITMTADLTAFAGLVFAWFFFWTIAPVYPPPGLPLPGIPLLGTGLGLALAAWALTKLSWARFKAGSLAWGRVGPVVAALPALLAPLAFAGALWLEGLWPREHAFGATAWVIVLWVAAHFAVGVIMHGYVVARSLAGRMTPRYDAELANVALYWDFMAITATTTFLLLGVFPRLAGSG